MTKMLPILGVVVALGLSMTVLGGLGVSDELGNTGGDSALESEVNETTENSDGDVTSETGSSGGFISFVTGAISELRDMLGLVLFLPSTLQNLGLPGIAAAALGRGAQLVISIGLLRVAVENRIE